MNTNTSPHNLDEALRAADEDFARGGYFLLGEPGMRIGNIPGAHMRDTVAQRLVRWIREAWMRWFAC